jgi:hypothetical protein
LQQHGGRMRVAAQHNSGHGHCTAAHCVGAYTVPYRWTRQGNARSAVLLLLQWNPEPRCWWKKAGMLAISSGWPPSRAALPMSTHAYMRHGTLHLTGQNGRINGHVCNAIPCTLLKDTVWISAYVAWALRGGSVHAGVITSALGYALVHGWVQMRGQGPSYLAGFRGCWAPAMASSCGVQCPPGKTGSNHSRCATCTWRWGRRCFSHPCSAFHSQCCQSAVVNHTTRRLSAQECRAAMKPWLTQCLKCSVAQGHVHWLRSIAGTDPAVIRIATTVAS